jgi:hypothetical protein
MEHDMEHDKFPGRAQRGKIHGSRRRAVPLAAILPVAFLIAALLLAAGAWSASRAAEPQQDRPPSAPALSGNGASVADNGVGSGVGGVGSNAVVDKLLDRIVERERLTMGALSQRTPLIETYIQETPGGENPAKDHYFLGRFRLAANISYEPLIAGTEAEVGAKSGSHPPRRGAPPATTPLSFLPRGFAQMAAIDLPGFNRETYHFEYVRREFLGEVRCLVFDVAPVNRFQSGKFIGRVWVEERDDAIVRFSGTYVPVPTPKGAVPELYFHFDSWRVNARAGLWVPAQIYVEEEGTDPGVGIATRFKAQSRIWDYAAMPSGKLNELTSILVEGASAILDDDSAKDVSPLESERSWERQAEDNLISRLEKGGLVAPPGPVDDVLNAVVNNLVISSKLAVAGVHCRVLLTTPIETFAVGRTIVISRGLVDVLPDEASLALVLADQLAHIALGHRPQTQYAFTDQTMVTEPQLLQLMRLRRTPEEMLAAGKKTIEIIQSSPYKDTSNAGLFLKALAMRAAALSHLLHANLGDQIADPQALGRLRQFADAAPALEDNKLEQIAALPLGSRIRLNPWDNRIELIKTRPLLLLSPREKMPFEVTPFTLYLTRLETPAAANSDANR